MYLKACEEICERFDFKKKRKKKKNPKNNKKI